jgi:hypothetical protein
MVRLGLLLAGRRRLLGSGCENGNLSHCRTQSHWLGSWNGFQWKIAFWGRDKLKEVNRNKDESKLNKKGIYKCNDDASGSEKTNKLEKNHKLTFFLSSSFFSLKLLCLWSLLFKKRIKNVVYSSRLFGRYWLHFACRFFKSLFLSLVRIWICLSLPRKKAPKKWNELLFLQLCY